MNPSPKISLSDAQALAVTLLRAVDGHTKGEALGGLTIALGSIVMQTMPTRAGREEIARRAFHTLLNMINAGERQ